MSEGEWLTYGEAAARLGMTADAVRLRIRRGTLSGARGNDGRPRVWVSVATDRPTDRDVRPTDPNKAGESVARPTVLFAHPSETTVATDRPSATDRLIESLERQVEYERTERDRERADHARQTAEREAAHAAEIVRLHGQHVSEINRLQAAYKAASDALVEKVATVLVAQRRRPWWRLLG